MRREVGAQLTAIHPETEGIGRRQADKRSLRAGFLTNRLKRRPWAADSNEENGCEGWEQWISYANFFLLTVSCLTALAFSGIRD